MLYVQTRRTRWSSRAPVDSCLTSQVHPSQPRLKCADSTTQVGAAEQLQYWDVVEFTSAVPADQPQRRLGLVQQVNADGVQVSPLVQEDEGVWVVDEDADEQQVAWTSVLQIVDHVYGQRQDQEHNPHGEHAHDVWQVMITIPEEVYRGNFKLTQ